MSNSKFTCKSEIFKSIYSVVIYLITFVACMFLIIGILYIDTKELLESSKIQKIYTIEETYKSDYTKSVYLDEVVITKGDDTEIKVTTDNYELKTIFDANGNYVESKIVVKHSLSTYIAVILMAVIVGIVINWLLFLPFDAIYKKFLQKDELLKEEIEKEERKKSIIEVYKMYPSLFADDYKKLMEEEEAAKKNNEKTDNKAEDE